LGIIHSLSSYNSKICKKVQIPKLGVELELLFSIKFCIWNITELWHLSGSKGEREINMVERLEEGMWGEPRG